MKMLSNGLKSWVTKERNKAFAEAPSRIKCPKCKHSRAKEKFGVRTFKDSKGKPTRFAMQSFCTSCRNLPARPAQKVTVSAAKKATRAEAKAKVKASVRRLVRRGDAEVVKEAAPKKPKTVAEAIRARQEAVKKVPAGNYTPPAPEVKIRDISEFTVVPAGQPATNWLDMNDGTRGFVTEAPKPVEAAPVVARPPMIRRKFAIVEVKEDETEAEAEARTDGP